MYHSLLNLTICAALLLCGGGVQAGQLRDAGCRAHCPRCKACCTLNAECGKTKKSCYEVECVEICIPRVVFPWQKWKAKRDGQVKCDTCKGCCDSCGDACGGKCSTVNNGARVKTIKKLKKKTYECPACQYEWVPTGNGSCANGACGGNDCCDVGCDAVAPSEHTQQALGIPVPTVDSYHGQPLRTSAPPAHLKPVATRTLSDD